MNTKELVLDILMEVEDFISGEDIAKKINVTRNSVWKAINKLKDEGNEIESIKNRGYKLILENDEMTISSIRKDLKDKNHTIEIKESVTSTNVLMKEFAENGAEEGRVLIAKHQTAGKGRRNRKFYSPDNSGIYMSILLRPKIDVKEGVLITTAAAVAVSKSISKFTKEDIKIKWVNDIYLNNRKISGILTEASIDFETNSLEYVVLGIGVNVTKPENGFDEEIENIASAIFDNEAPRNIKSKIVTEIINNFFEFYKNIENKEFVNYYKENSILEGKKIEFLLKNEVKSGVVLGIDNDARLIVKLENGNKEVYSYGEIEIKKYVNDKGVLWN